MDSKFILITLLVKLGVSAAIAAALVRSWEFHSRLFREESRSLRDTLILTIFVSVPYGLGVQVRSVVPNFKAADLAFESIILMGVIGGTYAGIMGAILVSIPAVLHGEYITLPFNLGVGLIAGALRDLANNKDDIWSFSPFIDLTIFRWIKRNLPRPRMDWQIMFFLVILVLQFARMQLSLLFPGRIYALYSNQPWIFLAISGTAVVCVAIPLKIWNNTRIELKLEEQTRLLLQARLDALQSQINPHFLFNTLNSVASLVRLDPDTARELIVKLSNILRELLRKHDAFCLLQEEVEFIDDYLDIEVIRFGSDKLRVRKDLDPATLDQVVPSMVLQPLIENSIKHGIAPKIDGGSITLRSRLRDGKLVIEIEDDGVGMSPTAEWVANRDGKGIGISNVEERLKVLYGPAASLSISIPESGEGTLVRLELPEVKTEFPESAAEKIYSERSRTRA